MSQFLSGNISTICNSTNPEKYCVVNISNDITVKPGFTCDRSALILVDGKLTVEPDLNTPTNPRRGCIWIVNDDVIFVDGTYKSTSSNIRYDIVNGFFIAEGQIYFPKVDVNHQKHDGLKINGGVLSLSNDDPSIVLQRSLGFIGNATYPAVAIHGDPRYFLLARAFISDQSVVKINDVGFKAY
jgi:hypothetical protein